MKYKYFNIYFNNENNKKEISILFHLIASDRKKGFGGKFY